MSLYLAKKTDDGIKSLKDAGKAPIKYAPWKNFSNVPESYASVCYDSQKLYVCLECFEDNPMTVYQCENDPVYQDSCLEFFIAPLDGVDRYCDFELNSNGVMLLGYYDCGNFGLLEKCDHMIFHAESGTGDSNGKKFWWVRFEIPAEFLNQQFPGYDFSQHKDVRCNFYKCCDSAEPPHYGCWSAVRSEKPDFFHSECFGILRFI